jgi:hypothetical protein
MPLARGSALCGYVSLLGAFLAAGAPVRAAMPKVSVHVWWWKAWDVVGVAYKHKFLYAWMVCVGARWPPADLPPSLGTTRCRPSPLRCLCDARIPHPQHYQTDWEAILESQPANFIASVSAWMLPPELAAQQDGSRHDGGTGAAAPAEAPAEAPTPQPPCPPVDQLPKVIELLPTMRARLEALNGPRVPRI